MLQASLGDITFSNGATDANGLSWWLETIDGWDSPDVRVATEDRPFFDGIWVADGFYGGRPLTVKGKAYNEVGTAEAQRAGLRHLGAVADLVRADGTLTVFESLGTVGEVDKQCTVRRAGRVRASRWGMGLDFEVPLIAADPRKYATALTSASVGLASETGGAQFPWTFPVTFSTTSGFTNSVTISNGGSAATWPVITVAGPVVTPKVELVGGASVAVNITLNAGDTLVFDMLNRTVILNGTASRRSLVIGGSAWFSLPPGSSSVRFTAAGYQAAALMTVAYRSAWI